MAIRVANFLSERLGVLYADVAEAIGAELVTGTDFDQLADGDVDAAFLCGLPYVNLRDRIGPGVEPLVAPVAGDPRYGGRPEYASDVIVRAAERATALEDVAPGRLAVNEPDSHSGHSIVLATLESRGVPPGRFAEVVHTGGHAASVAAVRSGRADVAAIDSHLLAALRADDPALEGELRVAESLGPSPSQPLAAGPSLGHDERAALTAALTERPPVEVAPGLSVAWAPVDDGAYDSIRHSRALARERGAF